MAKKYEVSDGANKIMELLRGTLISKLELYRSMVEKTTAVVAVSHMAMAKCEDDLPEELIEEYQEIRDALDLLKDDVESIQNKLMGFWDEKECSISVPEDGPGKKYVDACYERLNRPKNYEFISSEKFDDVMDKDDENNKVKGTRVEIESEEDMKKLNEILR